MALSQLLGEQAWHASGLGATADIDELQRKLTRLEQAQVDLTAYLDERTEELRAAREANRELTRAEPAALTPAVTGLPAL
jgi:hypothetical protein